MDPLSIAAGVAGLLTLAAQLIKTVDDLYAAVKKQPLLLKKIAQDLKTLQDVLTQLSTVVTLNQPKDGDALLSVLKGCADTLHDIDRELAVIRALFQRNIFVKFFAQITLASKMNLISLLRDQLDKYKSTLLIAWLLWDGSSKSARRTCSSGMSCPCLSS